tara:strand:- start:78 stop:524 length:447 start_codon:yes stop_codon:yes gene_type:complete
MAAYGRQHHIHISDTVDLISDQLRRDMFDGNEDATEIKRRSTSASIDPYTEEITYSGSDTWVPISGIVTTVVETDELLGNGRIKAGDTMVLYHYDTVSGTYLTGDMDDIHVAIPGVSGFYHVAASKVETVGGKPMFLKVGLKFDSNGQ